MKIAVLGPLALLALTGCKGVIESLCDQAASCAGGTAFDERACVTEGDASQEQANVKGCGSQWTAMANCSLGLSCSQDPNTACPSQSKALNDCLSN
jgi:hypothetical protein